MEKGSQAHAAAKRPAPRSTGTPARPSARKRGRAAKVAPAARKQAILDAALTVFAERGFEAARLDDVAARAGVAKGTLYLYFKDKEALFEELLRGAVSPLLEHVAALAEAPDMPFAKVLETLFAFFESEVLGTDRKLLIRLVIAEGPALSRASPRPTTATWSRACCRCIQKIAQRAVERGELCHAMPSCASRSSSPRR